MSDEIYLIFIVIGALASLFLTILWYIKSISPRRQEAEKRNSIVYVPLISKIQQIKDRITNCHKPESSFNEQQNKLLINKKSKKLITELQDELLEYNALDLIVTSFIKLKIEDAVKKTLKETEEKIREQNIGIQYTNSLTSYFISKIDSILKEFLLKWNGNVNWFEIFNAEALITIKSHLIGGESFELFFSEINRELSSKIKSGGILWFLKRKRERVFKLIDIIENQLLKDSKKLESWYSFIYGGGKKIILEKLEKNEQESSKLTVRQYRSFIS